MSEVMNRIDKISRYTIELADRLARRKKTVLALQLIEEIYRDIDETRAKQAESVGEDVPDSVGDKLLRKYHELKITGKQKNYLHVYQRTMIQAIIVSLVVSIFFLFGGYVATAYMKKQAKELGDFVVLQQAEFVESISQLRSASPLDLLNDIDRNLDDLKMTKLYAYLNADPRLFFEVAKTYEEGGQLDLAVANLRRALLFDPENRQYSKKLDELRSAIATKD